MICNHCKRSLPKTVGRIDGLIGSKEDQIDRREDRGGVCVNMMYTNVDTMVDRLDTGVDTDTSNEIQRTRRDDVIEFMNGIGLTTSRT